MLFSRVKSNLVSLTPPPKAYSVSVKPIYTSGRRNDDISHEYEEGRGRSKSRSIGGNGQTNNYAQDRSLNLSNLQAIFNRTGLNHYRELRGHPLKEIFQSLGLAMPNPRFMCSKCTGKRKALCVSVASPDRLALSR